MRKHHKILLLTIGILLIISLCVSTSYALWTYSTSQEGENVVEADCFEITLSDKNAISLEHAFPLKDSDGIKTKPYQFTIKNVCNHSTNLEINLETLSSSTLDVSNIKVDINGIVQSKTDMISVTPTLSDASSAYEIYIDTLPPASSKTYTVRMWIKEDAEQSEIENKSYASKISIRAILNKNYEEATLKIGKQFNAAIKTLSGDVDATHETANTSIKYIKISDSAPTENDNYIDVSEENSDPIYAWFEEDTIYLYTKGDKIFLNKYAAYTFSNFKNLITIDTSKFDSSRAEQGNRLFSDLENLIELDLSKFDTSKMKFMTYMFGGCKSLKSLDITNFDTSNVTSMYGMFASMRSLESLDLSHFDVSKLNDMNYMFALTTSLTKLDLSGFNTSNITEMDSTFADMIALKELDISSFDTSNVTSMRRMFTSARSLEKLNVSNFDTSKVKNMYFMFASNKIKNLDLSNFNTSNVTNMSGMFFQDKELETLDISSFDTSNVTSMADMFLQTGILKTIYVSDKWSTSKVPSDTKIFDYCSYLVGGAGTRYNQSKATIEYARVDDPINGNPGYFTFKNN